MRALDCLDNLLLYLLAKQPLDIRELERFDLDDLDTRHVTSLPVLSQTMHTSWLPLLNDITQFNNALPHYLSPIRFILPFAVLRALCLMRF